MTRHQVSASPYSSRPRSANAVARSARHAPSGRANAVARSARHAPSGRANTVARRSHHGIDHRPLRYSGFNQPRVSALDNDDREAQQYTHGHPHESMRYGSEASSIPVLLGELGSRSPLIDLRDVDCTCGLGRPGNPRRVNAVDTSANAVSSQVSCATFLLPVRGHQSLREMHYPEGQELIGSRAAVAPAT